MQIKFCEFCDFLFDSYSLAPDSLTVDLMALLQRALKFATFTTEIFIFKSLCDSRKIHYLTREFHVKFNGFFLFVCSDSDALSTLFALLK